MKFYAKVGIFYMLLLITIFAGFLAYAIISIVFLNEIIIFIVMLIISLFILLLLITDLISYIELKEEYLFIRIGLYKKKILYNSIKKIEDTRWNRSLICLGLTYNTKNIFYNNFNFISVSIRNEDRFFEELEKRRIH